MRHAVLDAAVELHALLLQVLEMLSHASRVGIVMAMWSIAQGMPNIDQFSGRLGRSRFSTRATS